MKIARKIIGLDIDCSSIKAAEFVRKGRNKVVTKLGEVPLDPGAIMDGKVENSGKFLRGLTTLLIEQNFSATSVVLGLRSSWITVKTHRLPQMSKRELDKVLEFEVPELISFSTHSPSDIAFDYFINQETDSEVEIVLVACPKKFLIPFVIGIREVGLTLEAIDLPALGWPYLLVDEKRRVFVEISEEQTTIQISLNGVFKVLRVVPVGRLQLRQGVQKAFSCQEEEAEKLCLQNDLDYLLMEGPGNKRVIRAVIQQFIGSVLQTLDFVRAKERAGSFRSMLDELVLIGDFADLKGLGKMLEKELDLPVKTLRNLEMAVSLDLNLPRNFNGYGSALALGLRGFN